MVDIPASITTRWIATLADEQLVAAEAELYTAFRAREAKEKLRAGSRYILLQGPSDLVNAWHQWQLLNNATRARGAVPRRSR